MKKSVENPCLACDRLHEDKNSAECTNCDERVEYAYSIDNDLMARETILKKESIMAQDAAPLPETKTCIKCKQSKPRSQFHKSTAWKDGCNSTCKACVKAKYDEKRASESQKTPAAKAPKGEHMNYLVVDDVTFSRLREIGDYEIRTPEAQAHYFIKRCIDLWTHRSGVAK